MKEQVLCIEKRNLSLISEDISSLEQKLNPESCWFIPRKLAEENENFLQIIPYVMVQKENGKVLIYQRVSNGNEQRLKSKWSIGVGGHINLSDNTKLDHIVSNACLRELKEEFNITDFKKLELIDILYDDSNSVGRVHLGLIYKATILDNYNVEVQKDEIEDFKWVNPQSLKCKDCTNLDFESWTDICIKKYF